MKHTSHILVLEPSVKIVPVASDEQTRRIHAAIARRAYEIFEQRGSKGHDDLQDWRQAEAEVLSKLCFGLTTRDHTILIGTDISGFEPGTVELWVAPHQITLCGQAHPHVAPTSNAPLCAAGERLIFREIRLPYKIDPASADTKMQGRFLDIKLPQMRPYQAVKRSRAA
jgi:HSP20 family molecular chaperone IbpA